MKPMYLPDEIKTIMSSLSDGGFENYVVGGCVRDHLMGNTPNDYDMTTNALPEQVKDCLGEYRIIDTGIKHGTVTVIINGMPVEITTFRTDGDYKDNRHPDSVSFTGNIKDDLSRRDFTVNAVAYAPQTGFVDLFGGRDDIEKKLIRCVGDPDKRFNEDGLRILRAMRFASQLGFIIEPETSKSIHKNRELLKNISSERILSELYKLLCGEGASYIISDYADVIKIFIPSLSTDERFYETVKGINRLPADKILRTSLLFDGMSKEHCTEALRFLRADKKTIKAVSELSEIRDADVGTTRQEIRRFVSDNSFTALERLIALRRAKGTEPQKTDLAEKLMEEVRADGDCVSLADLKINGRDIKKLGESDGVRIGEIIERIYGLVLDGSLKNEREILIAAASEIIRKSF
ncbi:MAG: CCA tRNA nucleotidyltransferase [Clostridiales bacterium]|nr:CCA tRNA nucleotidyltransferase [Clostridiales bacterium]